MVHFIKKTSPEPVKFTKLISDILSKGECLGKNREKFLYG